MQLLSIHDTTQWDALAIRRLTHASGSTGYIFTMILKIGSNMKKSKRKQEVIIKLPNQLRQPTNDLKKKNFRCSG